MTVSDEALHTPFGELKVAEVPTQLSVYPGEPVPAVSTEKEEADAPRSAPNTADIWCEPVLETMAVPSASAATPDGEDKEVLEPTTPQVLPAELVPATVVV
jgi:hypothetical protein